MPRTVFRGAHVENSTNGRVVRVTWEDHEPTFRDGAERVEITGRHDVYLPREVAEAAFQRLFGGVEVEAQVIRFYTARDGDCLSKIAERFGCRLDHLMEANGIRDSDFVRIGQRLRLPEVRR